MHSIDDMFKDISEWGSFHDVINEVRYPLEYCNYNVDSVRAVFDMLPETIKDQAQIYGISDSVVRDDAFVYLKEHPEIIDKYL